MRLTFLFGHAQIFVWIHKHQKWSYDKPSISMFFNENFSMLIKISMKSVHMVPIYNNSAFLRVWYKSLPLAIMTNLSTKICVARHPWHTWYASSCDFPSILNTIYCITDHLKDYENTINTYLSVSVLRNMKICFTIYQGPLLPRVYTCTNHWLAVQWKWSLASMILAWFNSPALHSPHSLSKYATSHLQNGGHFVKGGMS